jgi:hypothetical protein
MRRYVQTTLGNRLHLGRPTYNDDEARWVNPTATLCGLESATWSKSYVRGPVWSTKKPGAVCDTCDRAAMWESIISLDAK